MVASAAHAAPDEEGPDTVVVTATRIPTPEREVASSITVVDENEIAERQLKTLPDVLTQVPGLNVVQTGGPGGQTSVFMRGTNSNHTKVLVDGIDLSDPSNPTGAFDFSQFLTQDIERVEVLRGPQSGLYGSDAIGGVINIITKSGSGAPQGDAALEAGSFDTFNQSGGVRGSFESLHYAASIDHLHAGATPVTPLDLLTPGERRIDDYDDATSASTKLGLDIAPGLDVGLVARFNETHVRLTGDNFNNFPATPDTAQSENDARQIYSRATLHWASFAGNFDQTFGIAYSNLKSSDLSPDNPRSDLAGERVKADWQGSIALAQTQKLVLGAEHQRDEISLPIDASIITNSGYAELQSNWFEGWYDTVSVRYDDNDRFGGKATYRVAPEYLIASSGTKLKASVGTGFKPPTLDQLFQDFPDFGFFANPNLKPETSTGWDLGVEQDLSSQLRAGVTYYRNVIHDLITDNASFSSYINAGHVVTDGVESFIAYRPTKTLNVRLDYTYTEATDEDLHQELLRRPKHKVDFNTAYSPTEKLHLDASLVGVSSWIDGNRDFSIMRLKAAGYAVIDTAASYDLNAHMAFTMRVDNLFNRHYENPVGFLQPSIGAYAGIKAKF
jgi:vitamin B12 transporter